MLARLASYAGDAPIVFAGAIAGRAAARARRAKRTSRRERLVGSVTRSARRRRAGDGRHGSALLAAEVDLTVLGAPPSGFVVPWSEASIGGYSLERVLSQVAADADRSAGGATVAAGAVRTRAGRGARHRGAGASLAARIQRADGARRRVRRPGRVGAMPVNLSPTGIVHTRVPTLNTRERVRLETALGA